MWPTIRERDVSKRIMKESTISITSLLATQNWLDNLAQEDHSFRPSSVEYETYQKFWYLTLNKKGKNASIPLRIDFRASVTVMNGLHRESREERAEPKPFQQYPRWHPSSPSSSWWSCFQKLVELRIFHLLQLTVGVNSAPHTSPSFRSQSALRMMCDSTLAQVFVRVILSMRRSVCLFSLRPSLSSLLHLSIFHFFFLGLDFYFSFSTLKSSEQDALCTSPNEVTDPLANNVPLTVVLVVVLLSVVFWCQTHQWRVSHCTRARATDHDFDWQSIINPTQGKQNAHKTHCSAPTVRFHQSSPMHSSWVVTLSFRSTWMFLVETETGLTSNTADRNFNNRPFAQNTFTLADTGQDWQLKASESATHSRALDSPMIVRGEDRSCAGNGWRWII